MPIIRCWMSIAAVENTRLIRVKTRLRSDGAPFMSCVPVTRDTISSHKDDITSDFMKLIRSRFDHTHNTPNLLWANISQEEPVQECADAWPLHSYVSNTFVLWSHVIRILAYEYCLWSKSLPVTWVLKLTDVKVCFMYLRLPRKQF